MFKEKYSRILAISDIHGMYDKLVLLLESCQFDSSRDLVVILGDMVDRGPDSLAVVRECQRLQALGGIIIAGNHDLKAREYLSFVLANRRKGEQCEYHDTSWLNDGGEATVRSFAGISTEELEKIVKWLYSLPYYFEIEKYIFSHGGADLDRPISENIWDELMFTTWNFIRDAVYANKFMIFGHVQTYIIDKTIDSKNPTIWFDEINKDKAGIDCGAAYDGRLAALELPSMKTYYQ
ncbi:MAG: metallophosphoesterase [Bacillota bacterium]